MVQTKGNEGLNLVKGNETRTEGTHLRDIEAVFLGLADHLYIVYIRKRRRNNQRYLFGFLSK